MEYVIHLFQLKSYIQLLQYICYRVIVHDEFEPILPHSLPEILHIYLLVR